MNPRFVNDARIRELILSLNSTDQHQVDAMHQQIIVSARENTQQKDHDTHEASRDLAFCLINYVDYLLERNSTKLNDNILTYLQEACKLYDVCETSNHHLQNIYGKYFA